MPASPFDSALYRDLFGDPEVGQLFTDSAEVRAMMLVEGALAKVQGELGLIPEVSARAIHRASLELQIDPAGLSRETGRNGVAVPALVAAFRSAMNAPDHARFMHWGATSQDVIDTALALRLRQALAILDARLVTLAKRLGALAEEHADLPMTARTYGQAAVPTSFGANIAGWGAPLLRHRARLDALRPEVATVSLAGAAGTLSAMERGPELRAALAAALGLADPGGSRHATRDTQVALAGWLAGLAASLGKMGADLVFLSASGIGEVRLGGAGGSSTMPHKANPVGPSVLVALANLTGGLGAAMTGAGVHLLQRDGAAWFTEWLVLPQMVVATGRALSTAIDVAEGMAPVPGAMSAGLASTNGAVYAEALTFALARTMPRPEAAAAVKSLLASGLSLPEAARAAHPGLDLAAVFDPARQMGEAPAEARAFAAAARTL